VFIGKTTSLECRQEPMKTHANCRKEKRTKQHRYLETCLTIYDQYSISTKLTCVSKSYSSLSSLLDYHCKPVDYISTTVHIVGKPSTTLRTTPYYVFIWHYNGYAFI